MKSIIIFLSCFLWVSCGSQKTLQEQELDNTIELGANLANWNWMVMCLIPFNEFRTEFEKEVQQELDFYEVHSQVSAKYIPETLVINDDIEEKLIQLIKSLSEKGYTMLLVSKIEKVEKTKIDADGYFGDFALIHYLTNVYKIDKGDSQLEWSACLRVYEYQLPELSVQDFARAIVGKLANDNIIPDTKMELIEFYEL
jgi:hypothetical protein